jgi:hypothetical protein
MIETRIRDLGGKYVKADEKWAVRTVPAIFFGLPLT